MRTHQPATTVPGAVRTQVQNPLTGTKEPAFDKKGRPVWDMPKPDGRVAHFKNAACRAAFRRAQHDAGIGATLGIYSPKQASELVREAARQNMHAVPTYRGMTAADARYQRAQNRRAAHLKGAAGKTRRKKGGFKL